MKVLIIANARYKGGLSGSDAIYENFKKHWPCEVVVHEMQQVDYSPFVVCYCQRIVLGIARACMDFNRYDFIYSASDFMPDALPALVYRLKGNKWIAGYFLHAFRDNPIHYYTQKVVRRLIKWFADMVIVTNPTMYPIFPDKKKTWINGGIDLSLAGISDKPKIYDAVFCGRIHPSKGIDELLEIWELVRETKPDARLAIIGDGDLGVEYIEHKLFAKHGLKKYNGIDLLGYMGNERFEVYKQSKVVLYPTPLKYDHFSMAPVEAMACGCQAAFFRTPVVDAIRPHGAYCCETIKDFAEAILEDDGGFGAALGWEWAQQFDYKDQALRVCEDIQGAL